MKLFVCFNCTAITYHPLPFCPSHPLVINFHYRRENNYDCAVFFKLFGNNKKSFWSRGYHLRSSSSVENIALFQSDYPLLLLMTIFKCPWVEEFSFPGIRADEDMQHWGRCCSLGVGSKLGTVWKSQLCLPETGFVCTTKNPNQEPVLCPVTDLHRAEISQPSKLSSCVQTDGNQSLAHVSLTLHLAWQNTRWPGQDCLRDDANNPQGVWLWNSGQPAPWGLSWWG